MYNLPFLLFGEEKDKFKITTNIKDNLHDSGTPDFTAALSKSAPEPWYLRGKAKVRIPCGTPQAS